MVIQRLKNWWNYRKSWKVVDKYLEYKTVVKQSSGYAVTVSEVIEYENSVDGKTRKRRREEGNTWVDYGTNWEPGIPVSYNGKKVKCAEHANLFGDVARGYRR